MNFEALVLKFQSVISPERTNSFPTKIYLRLLKVGLTKFTQLADLFEDLGVDVDPQNGKSSLVCVSFKICNGSTLFEFTCTTRALNCENTNEESPGDTSIWNKWTSFHHRETSTNFAPLAHHLHGSNYQAGRSAWRTTKSTELSSLSFTKTTLWYIKPFPNPVGRTAKTSFWVNQKQPPFAHAPR